MIRVKYGNHEVLVPYSKNNTAISVVNEAKRLGKNQGVFIPKWTDVATHAIAQNQIKATDIVPDHKTITLIT